MRYLVYSNTVIDYLAFKFTGSDLDQLNSIFNDDLQISIITKIEVLGFSSGVEALDTNAVDFIDLAQIFELTPAVVDQTIKIRKQHKIKIADAIIAATAIVNNFTLLTHNVKDFTKIKGLSVVDPYTF